MHEWPLQMLCQQSDFFYSCKSLIVIVGIDVNFSLRLGKSLGCSHVKFYGGRGWENYQKSNLDCIPCSVISKVCDPGQAAHMVWVSGYSAR